MTARKALVTARRQAAAPTGQSAASLISVRLGATHPRLYLTGRRAGEQGRVRGAAEGAAGTGRLTFVPPPRHRDPLFLLSPVRRHKRLPTEQVVRALVAACGADPVPWIEDLRGVSVAPTHQGRHIPGPGCRRGRKETGAQAMRLRWTGAVATGCALLLVGAIAGRTFLPAHAGPVHPG